ncbi:MAG: thioredoxin [Thermoproteota archaeon]
MDSTFIHCMSGSPNQEGSVNVSSANFVSIVLNSGKPVVADFWAEWCPPCRAMKPIFEKLAKDYSGRALFISVNIDKNPDLATRYGILGIPTFLVIVGGKPVEKIVGACGEAPLKKAVEKHLIKI